MNIDKRGKKIKSKEIADSGQPGRLVPKIGNGIISKGKRAREKWLQLCNVL